MKVSIKKVIAFAITGMMLFAAGCSKNQQDEAKTKVEGGYLVDTLKLAGGQDWGGPNPFRRTARGPAGQKVTMIYDSLLDNGTNGRIPCLAKEYSVNQNTYTFKLNENAKWHDGVPVTANDVAFTLEYYKQHTPVSSSLGAGDKYIIESTKVIDDYTIEINVKEQTATTLGNVSDFHVLPKHIWENVSDPKTYDGEGAYVGCGMFKLKSYEAATGSYEYEAAEDYYRGKQVARRLLFIPVSDELLAFDNEEIDLTAAPIDVLERYKANPNIGFMEANNSFNYRMHINFDKLPEFKDVEMRKAIYYAINREQIVSNVLRGAGAAGSPGGCAPTNKWHNSKVETYEYNPERAKEVFNGKNIEITLTCSNSNDGVKIAELMKIDLETAGIKVNVKAMDTQSRDKAAGSGDYELILIENGGWGMEPTQLASIMLAGERGSGPGAGVRGWSNDKIQKLATEIPKEIDDAKRKDLYFELQSEVSKDIPLFFIVTSSSYSMFKKDYFDGWKFPFNSLEFSQHRISYMQNIQ